MGTAKAAQLISQQIGEERPEIAYTVGLLHDIGEILLALSFPGHYNQVIQFAAEKNCHIILAERELLNTDHCMIGKLLCDIWGLPEIIQSALTYHHEPMKNPEYSMLACIVSLADTICRKSQIGNPGDKVIPKPQKELIDTIVNNNNNGMVYNGNFHYYLRCIFVKI